MKSTIESLASAELARRDPIGFATYVNPRFQTPPVVRFNAALLHEAQRGTVARLVLSAPPGIGKSTTAQLAAAYVLGSRPGTRLLLVSASESLAIRNSRAVRDILQNEHYPWAVKIRDDASSVTAWKLSNGSECRALGTGGTVTGFRADYVICDDLQPDVMSQGTRDGLQLWFQSVLETRLEPGAPSILIQTRWSVDDLIARLQSGEDGDSWLVVNEEAINETPDDPLGREIGEALWPERWPVQAMKAKRAAVGSLVFDALYQGHPRPEGGRLFQENWFANNRYERLPSPPALQSDPVTRFYRSPLNGARADSTEFVRVCAFDGAGREKSTGSFSAMLSVMADQRGDVYVVDAERSRESFDDVRARLILHCERVRPDLLVVENAGLGAQMLGSLRASNFRVPILSIDPSPAAGKVERAITILPLCEAGKVHLPMYAPWLPDFTRELFDFPGSRTHDDWVDCFVYALQQVLMTQARRDADHCLTQQLNNLGDWLAR